MRARPDDPPERPLADRPPPAAEGRATAPFARDPAAPPRAEEPALELAFAWAPFPVEFGQSWWLDPTAGDAGDAIEPALAFAWAPFPVEFGQSWWLDCEEREAEPEKLPPATRQRVPPLGLVGSLSVHLLPLLILLDWTSAPAEIAPPIPVQLVLEGPAAASEPPPGRLAPEQHGESAPPPKDAAAPPAPHAAPPSPPQHVAAIPPPPPKPAAPRAPAPPPVAPPPPARRRPAPLLPAATAPAVPRAVPPAAAATQSDYFSYLVTLTRRHEDMLPLSFLAGRRGETLLTVVVLRDGTIARIAVKRSSGYPDIDARIVQMVAAVGRFPPPPQPYRGPSLNLDFTLAFPNALPP
ncbi:MAG TPA: TonB family protein [Stellaceae bacterium]|nr:TonB family protein [Stellaceae bacterium]